MSWLERIRHRPVRASPPKQADPEVPSAQERGAPGLGALFGALKEDGRHSILDFGAASDRHLRLLGRFAQQIRFAGFVPDPPRGAAWKAALEGLPPNEGQPYDVVLTWDVLDRLGGEERAVLIERLDEMTAPGARIYAVIDASGSSVKTPVRMSLVGVDRVSHTVVGPPTPSQPALLPAHVERLLSPFVISNAYTLRSGLREYVAIKG